MPRENLASLVEEMRRRGREPATVEHRGNRRLRATYGELAVLAGRLSAELSNRGIQPGERVVLWGESSATWIGTFFGCLLRGVMVVPLDAAGAPEFAHRVIADVSPKLIVADAHLLPKLSTVIPTLALEQLPAELPAESDLSVDPSVGPDTPFQIVFTSGTTSEPKGIVHTHRNVLASLTPIETEIHKYLRYERFVHPLRFFHTLPLSHVFGQFMGLWIPPILGAELHFTTDLEPGRLIESIRRERINVLIAVPRVMGLLRAHLLANDPALAADLERFASLPVWKRWWRLRRVHRKLGWRFWALICGGATLPPELESFWHTLGLAVIQGYGMTETAALVTLNHPFKIGRGTLGKPLPGREVKLGNDGEVLVRGEMLAAATWRGGALHSRTEEWLATGDLAAQDASGELRFLGRKGDVIVTAAGMNIHPADLEAALLQQEGVRFAAVVACDGPNGQEPVAALIFSGDDAQLAAAVRSANASLAEFQQIRRSLRWPNSTFPYTTTGKLLRRQIANWACSAIRGVAPGAKPNDALLQTIAGVTGEHLVAAHDDARLTEDLHLDSLARVQLQSLLESRWGTEIGDDAMAQVQTLGELRALAGAKTTDTVPQPQSTTVAGAETPQPPAAVAEAHSTRNQPNESLPYLHWPWSWPMQAVRMLFQELIARPLVFLLAAPRVTRDPAPLPDRPMLLIANHVTAYDGPLILAALPAHIRRRVAIAMSGELLLDMRRGRRQGNAFLNALAPLGYWLITTLYNVFPLPRLRGFRRSFAHAGEALDRGYSVMIFPEGHRSETGELQPFRQGIGLLAQESQVPVLPVALRGLGELRAGGHWVRSGRLSINVGTPVDLGPQATPAEWVEALETALRKAFGSARS
jgi:long-chain acyl-CoA synthetase